MKALTALAALAAASAFASVPAAAQDDDGSEKINQLIIYGEDECPKSEAGEITVCARLDESERYRIPPDLRQSDSPDNVSWTNRVKSFEAVGDFGPLSCSAVGLGSELGCTAKMIEAAYEEKKHGNSIKMAELVAKAREERLSTIDEEAAATQARVEQIEKEYMDRLKREDDTASATAGADNAISPDSNAELAKPPAD